MLCQCINEDRALVPGDRAAIYRKLLILVVVFPLGEIPDMPCAFDIVSPSRLRLQNSVIYPNRKQDIWDTLRLFVQCPLYFIGDPITRN
jgi:hypothetical protein